MNIIETDKHALLVTPEGELDHHLAGKMRTEIDKKLGRGIINIIFDFSHLSFMDSSGIGMIMGRYKRIQKLGGRVIIAAPKPQVKRIIEMSGLLGIIQISPSVKQALRKL